MNINIQVKGLKELLHHLNIQAEKLSNLQPFWHNVGEYMKNRTIKECFDKEQSPDGQKWKPLSQSRIKQRMKRHKSGNMKILQDTGELRRSVRYRAFRNSVIIGSNLKYSKIHQFGGTVQISRQGQYKRDYKSHKFKSKGNSYSYSFKVKIPARPFLGITQYDKNHIIFTMFPAYLKRHVFYGG